MIPDEAVEAAARELFFQHSNTNGPSLSRIWDEALNEDLKSPFMRDARAALEAAAPYMLAGLLGDLTKLAKEFDRAEGGTLSYTVSDGRFQMRKNAHDQLMYIVSDHDESQK